MNGWIMDQNEKETFLNALRQMHCIRSNSLSRCHLQPYGKPEFFLVLLHICYVFLSPGFNRCTALQKDKKISRSFLRPLIHVPLITVPQKFSVGLQYV